MKERGYVVYAHTVMGDPYIAKARNTLANKFLKSNCNIFIFLADDLQYEPEDLLRLVEAPGEVVAGAYRIKTSKARYPVTINSNDNGLPIIRSDGCVSAKWVQTGFLRINRNVFERIVLHYPERVYYGIENNARTNMSYDFFPQGTGILHHAWIGEDYGFCELWHGLGGKIWIIPDMNLTHYEKETGYPGNYHIHLMCLPGGKLYKG